MLLSWCLINTVRIKKFIIIINIIAIINTTRSRSFSYKTMRTLCVHLITIQCLFLFVKTYVNVVM